MYRNVSVALNEALDITAHLKPLVPHFKAIEKAEFQDLNNLIPPLLHSVCLVYSNSEHYNSPARIIILMQEVCNLLISLAKKHIEPSTVFQIEVEEALDKVNVSISTLKEFRNCFRKYKAKLPSYFSNNSRVKKWSFQEHLIFQKYDNFIERLKIISEFFNTANQFLKLEKVEIGGIRGKLLTECVRKVFNQFKDLYATFGLKTYDCSNPKEKKFLRDLNKFNSQVWKMDRKLAAVLTRAFDDSTSSDSIFKLFDIFGNLLQRGLIALEVSDKMPLLAVRLNEELDNAKMVFENQQNLIRQEQKLSSEKNVPITAGQLKFSSQLRAKITTKVKAFKNINHPVCYTQNGNLVFQKYKALNGQLQQYEDKVYKQWLETAESNTKIGLEKPLLLRDSKSGILLVNFSKTAMCVLTEVQYLRKFFPTRKIPKSVSETFKRFQEFRNYINMLDMIVDLYNYMKTNTADVDRNLIQPDILLIDKKIYQAETTINWNSEDILKCIHSILESVSSLNKRVRETQDNVILIFKEINQYETKPLFERMKKDTENDLTTLDIKNMETITRKRYEDLKMSASIIRELVHKNQAIFNINIKDSKDIKAWIEYLRYVDEIVYKSVLKMVATSLSYLLDETDSKKNPLPLFDLQMALFEPDIIFKPSINQNIVGNFYDLINGIIEKIFKMATLIPRVAINEKFPSYLGIFSFSYHQSCKFQVKWLLLTELLPYFHTFDHLLLPSKF